MRFLGILLLLVVMAGSLPAWAHDIGVTQAELREGVGNRYSLSVQTTPAGAHLFAPPMLPSHCRFAGNPRGAQGLDRLRFEFACRTPLTVNDTLQLPWRREGAMLTARWRDGSSARRFFKRKARHITVKLSALQAGSGSWLDAANRYLNLGIEHILLGIDHLLFVLALLLIVRGSWVLVKTITAFTVAHSITLGLATLGVIKMPTRPVEAAIALSIVFLCVEILHASNRRTGLTYRYPWVVAFAFGLLHGLGFAGALAKIGLPPREIPLALLFFNIGVEIGQLIFVAAVSAVIWALRRRRLDRWAWARAVPVYVIGTLATYWLMTRFVSMISAT